MGRMKTVNNSTVHHYGTISISQPVLEEWVFTEHQHYALSK